MAKKEVMDYLWAPKSEGIVAGLLDHLGFTGVGKSGRFPTGVKYDCLIAINEAVLTSEEFASMVASRTHDLQGARKSRKSTIRANPDSIVKALQAGTISEAELKEAMKKAGII
tara:strand:- start:1906 stop:2244 length:339 start_codon:yes stop_codon:yes gene_type:complete